MTVVFDILYYLRKSHIYVFSFQVFQPISFLVQVLKLSVLSNMYSEVDCMYVI